MSLDIAVIYPEFAKYGGSEIYCLQCLARWQHVADITVYAQSWKESIYAEYGIDLNRITIVQLPKRHDGETQLLQDLLVQPKRWERHIGRHDVYLMGDYPAHYVRRRPAIHLIHEPLRLLYDRRLVELHGDEQQTIHLYPQLDLISEAGGQLAAELEVIEQFDANARLDRIATSSEKTSEYIRTVYGRPADLVAYPGVTPAPRAPGRCASRRAIFAGNLWPHKRIHLLIEAIGMVPEGELLIVGDGPQRAALKTLTDNLDLADRVHFLGQVENDDLMALYAGSACGAYTPENEPMGMVPLEIAAAGRPSVVTRDGGYSEILDDTCAMMVAPQPLSIAAALRKLFDNPDLADDLGEAARRRVSALHWDVTAERIMNLLQEAADRRIPATPVHRPLYGAHYYPWYRSGEFPRHWNENARYSAVADMPVDGAYDSTAPDTARRHLKTASDAGLDHFIINLHVGAHGIDEHDLAAARLLFSEAEQTGFRLAILFALDTGDPAVIESAIAPALQELTGHASYLHIADQPAIWYFVNVHFIGYFYNHERSFNALNDGYRLIATGGSVYSNGLPRHLRARFDGWSLYSPLQVCDSDGWRDTWERSYYDFHHDAGSHSIRVFTICPGYDDSALQCPVRSRQRQRKYPREDGGVFSLMQNTAFALNPAPDVITLTSFNEFHERTHIEPCEANGDFYIQASKAFSDRLGTKSVSGQLGLPPRASRLAVSAGSNLQ